jgi:hypothetical protein
LYSQKRKEYNCFDAEEFSNGFHWLKLIPVCLIEEYQTIHGNELRKVVDGNHVRECYISSELSLTIHTCQFTDTTQRYGALKRVRKAGKLHIKILYTHPKIKNY